MKCPLQMIGELVRMAVQDSSWDSDNVSCDEKGCGWWNDKTKECAILTIAKAISK